MPGQTLSELLHARRLQAQALGDAVLEQTLARTSAARQAATAERDAATASSQGQLASAAATVAAAQASSNAQIAAAQRALSEAQVNMVNAQMQAQRDAVASRNAALVVQAARIDAARTASNSDVASAAASVVTANATRAADLSAAQSTAQSTAAAAATTASSKATEAAASLTAATAQRDAAQLTLSQQQALRANPPGAWLEDGAAISLMGHHGSYVVGSSSLRKCFQHPVEGQPWDHMRLVRVSGDGGVVRYGDQVALQLPGGLFVTAKNDHSVAVYAPLRDSWETFTLLKPGDASCVDRVPARAKVQLKSAHGRYLCVEQNGTVVADRVQPREWETFSLQTTASAAELAHALWQMWNGDVIMPWTAHGTVLVGRPFLGSVAASSSPGNPVNLFQVVALNGAPEASLHYHNPVGLRLINGLYLTARPDGSLDVSTSVLDIWERWTPVNPLVYTDVGAIPRRAPIAFRSYHGKYLCAERGGGFVADRANIDTWETFRVDFERCSWPDPWYMRSGANFVMFSYHNYVVLSKGTGDGLYTGGSTSVPPQRFRMVLVGGAADAPITFGSQVALQLPSSGRYVTCQQNGTLSFEQSQLLDWEKWTIFDATDLNSRGRIPPNPTICLKSFHGKYLCAYPDRSLAATAVTPSIWEGYGVGWESA